MALTPKNEAHGFQIEAGTVGRKRGHAFERELAATINTIALSCIPERQLSHLETGNPALLLLGYISQSLGLKILKVKAYWLGGLATAHGGDELLDENGNQITKCKSDILLDVITKTGIQQIGVSVKTCNKRTPTNDQMFFTTTRAFCQLLIQNGIPCSEEAIKAMSMFCGDVGFRPIDTMTKSELLQRVSDPNRFYWEELSAAARNEWEKIFKNYQDKITLLLFQKAYKDDPYPPDLLLRQTVQYSSFDSCQVALFTMSEIVSLSRKHSGYMLSPYIIRKGTYKNDSATHCAPRFGFIQFQRGGQKQHPTQLQFNLKAGYFNHLPTE
ncbi:MAG: hypothetical protein LBO03_03545 [Acidaminococcales bacterium]|jgi:hypothetical protein|nr:hypothetical protein [Acidaminococcales bacterium]